MIQPTLLGDELAPHDRVPEGVVLGHVVEEILRAGSLCLPDDRHLLGRAHLSIDVVAPLLVRRLMRPPPGLPGRQRVNSSGEHRAIFGDQGAVLTAGE